MRSGDRLLMGLALTGAGLAILALARKWEQRESFWRGKRVIITGGSRGLGLVMARQLAARGAHLALLARDVDELDHAVSELAEATQVLPVVCDLRRASDINDAVKQVVQRFGGVDVLINNAGVIQVGPLDHMRDEDFREAMDIHLFAPLYLTLAVRPHMQRQGGGRIVNISSIGGKVAVPHLLPYCASKFALVGLSEGLRAELAIDGIVVTTVCPGLMRTGSPPNAFFKGRRRAEYAWFAISDANPLISVSAEYAARTILEACRQGRARLIISLPAKLGVMFHELCPETYARLATLANTLLPSAREGGGADRFRGYESESALAPSLLTILSDRASLRNNEAQAPYR